MRLWIFRSWTSDQLWTYIRSSRRYCSNELSVVCDPASDHHDGDDAKLNPSSFEFGGGLHLEATDGPAGAFAEPEVDRRPLGRIPARRGVTGLGGPSFA